MKTEDFDEAIRQKLDVPDQKVTSEDVGRVMKHLRRHGVTGATGFRWGPWLFGAGGVITGIVAIWFLTHPGKETTGIVKSINPASDRPANEQKQKVQEGKTGEPAQFTRSGDERHSEKNSGGLPGMISNGKTGVHPAGMKRQAGGKSGNNAGFPETVSDKPSTGENAPGNEGLQTPDPAVVPDMVSGNAPEVSDQQSSRENEKLTFPDAGTADTLHPGSDQDGNSVETGNSPESRAASATPAPDGAEMANPETEKHPDSHPDGRGVAIGAASELSLSGIATGPALTVNLPGRLRLTTGIDYVSLNKLKFADKRAFDNHNPHKLNPDFKHQLDNQNQASDIRVKSHLLQLPLSVGYSIPLRNHYAFTFALGTHLDLYLQQQLSFRQSDSLRPPPAHIRSNGNATLLNNLQISTALERSAGHWTIVVAPFIRPQLKAVFYKPRELDYGLKFGLFYHPGK